MTDHRKSDFGGLYRGALMTGLVLILAVNLPGHMTTDSVIQLAEGRAGEQRSFNPAFMSWLLGRFDSLLSGTSLFVAFNAGVLFASLIALSRLAPRAHWLAVVLAALAFMTPQLLIYQGAVWKDVMFANFAIAGTICLAFAAERWSQVRSRVILLAGGALLLAIAALVRQNGVLALLAGSAGLILALRSRSGWRTSLVAGMGVLAGGAAVILLSSAILHRALPQLDPSTSGAGLRIIQHFDIIGVLVRDPQASLEPLESRAPKAADALRGATAFYSAERIDTLDQAKGMGEHVWTAPAGVVPMTWANLVIREFPDYASHRLEVFRQVFLTPDVLACLPVTTGVQGPEAVLAELDLPARQDRRDNQLFNYSTWLHGTPVLSHLPYALISLATMVLLVLRGRPSDFVMAGLQAGALAFAGSFLVIALACDYRYLYFLDLAAITGVIHLALDPSGLGRRFWRRPT
ncbi:MAG: hypothetical protein IM595_06330 [Phenylobacterium sp.]|nr:hypothetical protein [Phenylobacterium sp.]